MSDHLPIVVWPIPSIQVRKRKKFRFENYWLKEQQCKTLVDLSWKKSEGYNICARFEACSMAIWKWVKDYNGNFHHKLEAARKSMEILRNRIDDNGLHDFENVQRNFIHLLQQQDSFWRQRAKLFWYKGGDSNSKYFHNMITERQRNNALSKLHNLRGD
ncbi:PREDICTED: uncharacterized protein LOC109166011 [Ipomoea nil]|uniref:uncharacterized protein LOC109166011 n=1 Tax=Ipomoea nil TaxID=35883 RepID=UPI0009010310|nr:PREDICTED: uncharacterized protein LOC109166011 [Ipomoea nil]